MAKTTWQQGLTMVSVNVTFAFHGGYDERSIKAVVDRMEECAERLEGLNVATPQKIAEIDLNTDQTDG